VNRLLEAVSYGGGVNSTALVVYLVEEQGWAGEIVFADTGAEWPETYCYMTYFEREYLQPRGLGLTIVRGEPWQHFQQGISLIDYCEQRGTIPLAAVRWCSIEWKQKPIGRWVEAHGIERQALGIDAGEDHRRPAAYRPLVEAGIDRRGCIEIIKQAGLDVPPKSGCYICPFMDRARWRRLWELHPDLFERAARLEELAGERRTRRPRPTLDPSGAITLRQRQAMYEGQIPMFEERDMDEMLAYRPCVCDL
jgi:hypothetical protein